METRTPLVEEFLTDHKQMSRLLYEALAVTKQRNVQLARELAARLNYVSGPHIQYEEKELYPRLKNHYGRVSEEGLKREHHEIALGIRSLIQDQSPDTQALDEVERRLQIGLDHAGIFKWELSPRFKCWADGKNCRTFTGLVQHHL